MAYEKGPCTIPTRGLGVVLIDMQELFVSALAEDTARKIIRAQTRVIGRCADKDIPLAVVEYDGDGPTLKELTEAISRVPRTVTVQKYREGGFDGDIDLDAALRQMQIHKLLLMGIYASQCVKTFGDCARKRGYEIATARPLIANILTDEKSNYGRSRASEFNLSDRSKLWYSEYGTFFDRVPRLM